MAQKFVSLDTILDWYTEQLRAGKGVIEFGLTEHGRIGVWLPDGDSINAKCDGIGDDMQGALVDGYNRLVMERKHGAGADIKAALEKVVGRL